MDPGADSPAGAVAEMIALVPFGSCRVRRCQCWKCLITFGLESLGLFPSLWIVMHAPDVENDSGAFGQMHAVDLII